MADVGLLALAKEYADKVAKDMLLAAHPVGSLYWSECATEPSELFGGEWERVKDKFVLAAGDKYSAGSNGGEAEHTLNEEEMPSHSHGIVSGDKYLIAATSSIDRYTVAQGTGMANVLTSAEMVVRATQGTYKVGGGKAHNNMPPFETYYCWKRIK